MAFFNRFGGRNLSGKGITTIPTYKLNITSDTDQYDVRTNAITAGWDGSSRCNILINIASGVTVYSSSTSTPALKIELNSGNLIPGTTVKIVNQGQIIGAGGSGGAGAFTEYKSQHVNTVHPNYDNSAYVGDANGGGLHWYMTHDSVGPTNGGDAIYTDQNLIIDTVYSGAKIGGGGGGGGAGRMGIYGTGGANTLRKIKYTGGGGYIYYTQYYGYAPGGAGGGGQGGGTCAGGTAGSYDAWFTYNGYQATNGMTECQGNAGTAGSLTAPGTGGAGKDSGEGTGKVFDTGGTGGTLGAIGSYPVWGTNTYGYVFYGYENCGPSSAGSDWATRVAGATGYPAGAYNPDNLYGGCAYGVRRGSGGYAIRKANSARTISYTSGGAIVAAYMFGTIG